MSMTEADMQHALWLHLRDSGHGLVAPNFTPPHWWECDVFSLTEMGYAMEHEIKTCRGDFQRDRLKGDKHARLARGDARGPAAFYFACPPGVLSREDLPAWAGLREITLQGRVITLRRAPILHRQKMGPEALLRLARTFCGRFWQLREGRVLLTFARKEAA